jgi:uncharacterized protein (TIGR03083 family)
MDLTTRELLELGLDTVESSSVPPGLRDRVLAAAATRVRPAMHPAWSTVSGDGLSPFDAFVRTAAGLASMLETLDVDEWRTPTGVEGASVRGLIAHLVGVERYILGQLGHGTTFSAPRREDHFPMSREAAADIADIDGTRTAQVWWDEVTRLIAVCCELDPATEVGYHHLNGTLRGLLVVRTFELWTHDDDIRRAVNRPPNVLDAERLALMSSDLVNVLHFGMALSGTTQPGRTARIALTGPGGGDYVIALAPGEIAGLPEITISTSALDFCRLASNRLTPDLLHMDVEGDRSLLEPILVGAGAFACD